MSEGDLLTNVLAVLAEIRAVPIGEVVSRVETEGLAAVMVSSLEVVTILVTLESLTGLDPNDPSVLKGCDLQSLQQLVEWLGETEEGSK
jgi:hypothetical protein